MIGDDSRLKEWLLLSYEMRKPLDSNLVVECLDVSISKVNLIFFTLG